jgi:hypothetical protein
MISARDLIRRLPEATGISASEAEHRILTLMRAGVIPKSKQGRGASTPLTEENMADVILSLLSTEALKGPEWVERFSKMECVEGSDVIVLREWLIALIGSAKAHDNLQRVHRVLARCHPEKPFVEVEVILNGRPLRLIFSETKSLDTEELLIDRSMIISGAIFPLFANWLWGNDE